MFKYNAEQMYLMGQVHHWLIETRNPGGDNPYPSADIFPLKHIIMLLPHANHAKLPKQVEAALAKLMGDVAVDDMPDIVANKYPSPLELRMNWYNGYRDFKKLTEITRLEQLRKAKNYTQAQLAKQIGVTQKDISRWENGLFSPNAQNLKKLAEALNCSVDEII